MVEYLGRGGEHLGTYSGILAAAFCFGQVLSSFAWAKLADRAGRKPSLLWGTLGTAIGMFIFGLSQTYTQAVAGRFISGCLCGNLLVLKTFLAEITDETNRGQGFSTLSIAWSMGVVIAPLIGGLLCEPADRFPSVFSQDGIFGRNPYFLPCLVTVVYNMFAVLFVWLLLEETKVGTWYQPSSPSSLSSLPSSSPSSSVARTRSMIKVTGSSSAAPPSLSSSRSPLQRYAPLSGSEPLGSDDHEYASSLGAAEAASSVDCEEHEGEGGVELIPMGVGAGPSDQSATDVVHEGIRGDGGGNSAVGRGSVFWRREVLAATGNYGLIAFAYVILDETLPLFLKLDEGAGGFGFASDDIGVVLSVAGFAMLLFVVTIFPMLANGDKPKLFWIGMGSSIPTSLLYPMGTGLVQSIYGSIDAAPSGFPHAYLICIKTAQNIAATFAFTAVVVQVNEAVCDDELADANALGQVFAALSRAIGPGFGGLMWSLSLSKGWIYANFVLVAGVFVGAQVLNTTIVSKIPRASMVLNEN